MGMTPQERAEARKACDVQHETAPEAYLADLLWKALNALEATERERDFADAFHKAAVADRNLAWNERDTARAQVETLTEALRYYAIDPQDVDWPADYGSQARDALKAAGIDTSTAKEST